MMTMLPSDRAAIGKQTASIPASRLERVLRVLSVATMLMTVPQVLTIWIGGNAGGVSIMSWGAYPVSACPWFVYGLRKHDKTICLACVGWIALDATIVAGVIVHA